MTSISVDSCSISSFLQFSVDSDLYFVAREKKKTAGHKAPAVSMDSTGRVECGKCPAE